MAMVQSVPWFIRPSFDRFNHTRNLFNQLQGGREGL